MKIQEQLQNWQEKVQELEKQVQELTVLASKQAEVIEELLQNSKSLTQITKETNANLVALLQQQLGD